VLVFSILYNVPKFAEVLSPLGESDLYYIIYSNILYLIFLLYLPLVSLTYVNVRLISALKALKRKRQEMQQVHDNNCFAASVGSKHPKEIQNGGGQPAAILIMYIS